MTGRVVVKNGYWNLVINYKAANGEYKQHWKKTDLKERGNKKIAEKLLGEEMADFAVRLKQQEYDENKEKRLPIAANKEYWRNLPFDEWLRKFAEDHTASLSVSSRTSYFSLLKVTDEYFKPLAIKLEEITQDDIIGFYDYLRQTHGIKEITIKHYSCLIRPALKKAYQEKIIHENPHDFVPTIHKEKHLPTFYNKEEMQILFEAIKGHELELEFKMLAYYGLRRSELLGLKWDAIDFACHESFNVPIAPTRAA